MLRNGKYVKEKKLRIGIYYTPPLRQRELTPEELFMQRVNLKVKPALKDIFYSFLGRVLKL
jgi:hypothetical protein